MGFAREVTGMVLSAAPVNDFDKRLVILTKERGKITAFARGARKPTSQYLACSQAFVYGKFTVYEGANAYTLNGAEVEEFFVELREDLDLVVYGLYFCELADYYTMENQPSADVLKLLVRTMKELTNPRISLDMIKAICELKISAINGEAPLPCECTECHRSDNLVGVSFSAGGAVCADHERVYKDVIHLVPPAIYAVYYVITSDIDRIYAFKLEKQAEADFIYYLKRYMARFVNREFKALQMLQTGLIK